MVVRWRSDSDANQTYHSSFVTNTQTELQLLPPIQIGHSQKKYKKDLTGTVQTECSQQ